MSIHSMKLMRDETFGPVLPIMTFKTDEEAIRLANDSIYGLTASASSRATSVAGVSSPNRSTPAR